MSKAKPTYWIVHGFGGNERLSKYFHPDMRKAGFQLASSYEAADIIIAHSGGCLDLPSAKGKHVFLCQPPAGWQHGAWRIWYDKTRQEIKGNYRNGVPQRWVWKVALNQAHLVTHPRHTRRIIQLASRHRFTLPSVECERLITIINKRDPWSQHITLDMLRDHPNCSYLGLDATHDELWTHPKATVDLIAAIWRNQ